MKFSGFLCYILSRGGLPPSLLWVLDFLRVLCYKVEGMNCLISQRKDTKVELEVSTSFLLSLYFEG